MIRAAILAASIVSVGCGAGAPPVERSDPAATTAPQTDPTPAPDSATDTATDTATDPATARDPDRDRVLRSGIQVRFAGLDTTGGIQGTAFLPVSSREVQVDAPAPAGGCAAGRTTLRAQGRLARGPVRAVRVELTAADGGERIVLGAAGCVTASVEVTLDDGTTLSGGEGFLALASLDDDGFAIGDFSLTTRRNDEPVTVSGRFTVRRP